MKADGPILRSIRVSDFVAEILEAEADRIPPSCKDRAVILRAQAKLFRGDDRKEVISIWQERPIDRTTTP
jgi:hypothetical protein